MTSLCLLVHEPFRVVFKVWEIYTDEDATAGALQALDMVVELNFVGLTASISVVNDEEPVEKCGDMTCVIRRAYIQEVLNDLRGDPERPLQNLIAMN